MQTILKFLGHLDYGVTELRLERPGKPALIGFFDDPDAIDQTIADYADDGTLLVGVQPRIPALLERSGNKLKEGIPGAASHEIIGVGTIGVEVHKEPNDEERIDSSTVAMRFVAKNPQSSILALTWAENFSTVLVGIRPIPAESTNEILPQLHTFARMAGREEDAEFVALTDWTAYIPLNAVVLSTAARVEQPKLRAFLHREIPEHVHHILNKSAQGRLNQLWLGKAKRVGTDNKGQELSHSAANYDRQFITELLAKHGKDLTLEDTINTLWNRPGSAARADGMDAVKELCEELYDRYKRASKKEMNRDVPKPGQSAKREFSPDTPLGDRLRCDYYVYSPRQERYTANVGIDLMEKARKVIKFLEDNGSDFFYFAAEGETVFTYEGAQYVVDTDDTDYCTWFTTHVEMFAPRSQYGKSLTDGIVAAIQSHPKCRKPKSNHWGHLNRRERTMYLCFDPDNREVVRIRPSEDGSPNVDIVPNGTDGITLRGPLERTHALKYTPGPKLEARKLMREIMLESQPLPDHLKLISLMFNITTLIPSHRTRPIKFHRGYQGSGKTTAGKNWIYLLYGKLVGGEYTSVPEFVQDVKAAGPMVFHDNAEAKERRPFMRAYRVMATGMAVNQRVLYKTAKKATFEPNANILISAIEPMEQGEDIDRCFEFEFDSSYWSDAFMRDDERREDLIVSNGDAMLSWIFDRFSTKLLPNFDIEYEDALRFVEQSFTRMSGKGRYSNWIAWMYLMLKHFGPELRPKDANFDAKQIMATYISELEVADHEARIQADPCMSCFDQLRLDAIKQMMQEYEWQDRLIEKVVHNVVVTRTPGTGVITIGPLTTAQLHRCFMVVSRHANINFPYREARQLGSRLSGLVRDTTFLASGWERKQLPGRAHNNQNRYVYTYTPVCEEDVEPIDEYDIGEDLISIDYDSEQDAALDDSPAPPLDPQA